MLNNILEKKHNWEYVSSVELTQEQKEKFWQTTLSGSKMPSLIKTPYTLLEDYNTPKSFSKTERERMNVGTLLEEPIIKHTKEFNDDAITLSNGKVISLRDIQIDKRTLISKDNSCFTLNIDGFIGSSLNDVDAVVEVKCTKATNIREVYNSYYAQCQYEMAFLNTDYCILLVALGRDLLNIQYCIIERNNEYIENLINKGLQFLAILNDQTPENLDILIAEQGMYNFIDNSNVEKIVLEGDLEQHVESLYNIKENIKVLEAQEKKLKQDLIDHFGNKKLEASNGSLTLKYTTNPGKEVFEKNILLNDLRNLYNISIDESKYLKVGASYTTISVSKKKGK